MIESLEIERLEMQASLDAEKSQAERNKLGQFATPTDLARGLLRYLSDGFFPEGQKVRFLDPAVGTGSFYSALRHTVRDDRIEKAEGFEIDEHYGSPAKELWGREGLAYHIGDFVEALPRPDFNLVVCNPPYVRHHHLEKDKKAKLQTVAQESFEKRLSGLAGLYCYFIARAHEWMEEGGIAAWLIPSEFMDVNYGSAVKHYLLEQVELLQIHRFDPNDVQFADALVSSAIVIFRKQKPRAENAVEFTFGGSLATPTKRLEVANSALKNETKWTRFPAAKVRAQNLGPKLSDFFRIKRGIATGDNRYFILTEAQIEERELSKDAFRSILPSPRYLQTDRVERGRGGAPKIEKRLFLLDPKTSPETIEENDPALWQYLEEGRERGLHERYLCSHRKPWYSQEKRDPAPIICTYLGRSDKKNGRPFRFILNHSDAIMANVYLGLYPTPILQSALRVDPALIEEIWKILNAVPAEDLLGEGRVYGGGLHKLEPRELANLPVPQIAELLPIELRPAMQGVFELEAAE